MNDPLPSAISVWDTAHCQHHCTNFIPWQLCLSSRFFWTLTLDNSGYLWDGRLPTGSPCGAHFSPRVFSADLRVFATCIKIQLNTIYARGSQRLSHTILHTGPKSTNPCKGKSLIWAGRRRVFTTMKEALLKHRELTTGCLFNTLQGDSSGNNSVRSWHWNITGLITRYNRLMSCLWGGGDGAKQGLQSTRLIYNSDVAQSSAAHRHRTRTITDGARDGKLAVGELLAANSQHQL